MHLWPSVKVRDSFKIAHLRKIERYNSDNKQQKQQQELDQFQAVTRKPACNFGVSPFCRDILLIFTCCFCFGIFRDEEEINYI